VASALSLDPEIVVAGLGDVDGGRYAEGGLDPAEVRSACIGELTVAEMRTGDRVSAATLLECPCDVLIPAAVSGVINEENESRVGAKIIVEGANGPTTTGAEAALLDRGVVIVPDILANAGGVIVSWLETVQMTQSAALADGPSRATVEERLHQAFDRAHAFAERTGVSLRDAAVTIGVDEVARAHAVRGLYP
jgi:glutamate dehydrogenase (NAD(P)+)